MSRRVSFARFLLLDGLAALISAPVWIGLGYYGAENREWLLAWIRRGHGAIAIAVVVLVVGAGWLFRQRASRRRQWLRRHRARRLDRDRRGESD